VEKEGRRKQCLLKENELWKTRESERKKKGSLDCKHVKGFLKKKRETDRVKKRENLKLRTRGDDKLGRKGKGESKRRGEKCSVKVRTC